MANIPIWPGSSSFHPGDTPFGFYDKDPAFEKDADKVCTFVTRRLGYPLVEIELQAINIYAAFEEAVTVYGNELYAYKIRENYLTLEGAPTSIDIEESIVTPNLGGMGYGGGYLMMPLNYDMQIIQQIELNDMIRISNYSFEMHDNVLRVFPVPTSGNPGTGPVKEDGITLVAGGTGYGSGITGVTGGTGTGLTINITQVGGIITGGTIVNKGRGYSNGDLITVGGAGTLGTFTLAVSAGAAGSMWVEFMLKSDRSSASIVEASEKIKYVSGVPYKNPKYHEINSVGRSWIFEFTLAICKEVLGYIRGKYETIPIPNAEITLNQADLIAAAREEKEALLASLRAFFDETSREKLLERRTMESNFVMEELDRVPRVIYIG